MAMHADGMGYSSALLGLRRNNKNVKRFSDNFYSWNENDGFRICSHAASVRHDPRDPIRDLAPRHSLERTVANGTLLMGGKKCACGNPEPLNPTDTKPSDNDANGQESQPFPCVCKFDPTVEVARTMLMCRRSTPRLIEHTHITALPLTAELDRVSSRSSTQPPSPTEPTGPYSTINITEVAESAHSGDSPSRHTPSPSPPPTNPPTNDTNRAKKRSWRASANTSLARLLASLPTSTSTSKSPSALELQSTSRDLESGPNPTSDSHPKSSSRKSSSLRWSLVTFLSNLILLATVLTLTLLFLWPAVEQARFPLTNYGYAPHAVSVSRHPVSNGAGNVTASTTTTVEMATLGTVDIPARLLDANPKDRVPVGGTLVAAASDGTGSVSGNGKNGNETLKLPKGYFSHPPFERTVQAEFRKSAFPALILGLAILFLVQICVDGYVAVCATGELRHGDGWTRSEKGAARRNRWTDWRRAVSWKGRGGRRVEVARIKGIFALVRVGYVLVVVVVCVSVAAAKVGMGKAAP